MKQDSEIIQKLRNRGFIVVAGDLKKKSFNGRYKVYLPSLKGTKRVILSKDGDIII